MKLIHVFLVVIGGGIGAFLRYGIGILSNRFFGAGFPVGTLFVNLAGCLLIGIFFSLAEQKLISPNLRVFLITGFLGALTTFSTYAVESVLAVRDGVTATALLNIAASNIGGLALVVLGLWIGRLMY